MSFVGGPFRTGGVARAEFYAAWTRGSLHSASPRFHLRCLREDPSGFGGLATRIDTLADCVPRRSATSVNSSDLNLVIEFELPSDAPPSDLLAARPVYWQLDVEVPVRSDLNYRQRFFVPVAGR